LVFSFKVKSKPELRKNGWITIHNIDRKNDQKFAKLHDCKFIFKNNKIESLK